MEVKKTLPAGAAPLLAEADRVDLELAPPAAAPDPGPAPAPELEAAPPPTLEHELAGMVAMIGTALAQFFPSTKGIIDEAKAAEVGGALAPVVVKYGLERHFLGFAWRVELHAAIVVAPVVIAMRDAIRHDLDELARRSRPGAPGGDADPGGDRPAGPPAPPSPGALVPVA